MSSVSIIIPIYNAEKYLEEMLESVLMQSLQDFEVICVIDCSPDNSLDIIQRYQKNDERVRIIENERNIGAAESRNRGMEESNAPFICFFDADDVFESDLLEVAYRTICEENADLVLYEHDTFSGEFIRKDTQVECVSKYTNSFCIKDLPEEALTYWGCAPWNKMFRKEFIVRHNLKFQDLPSANDVFFSDMSMLLAERIAHVPTNKKYVHYRTNSATQISAKRNPKYAWDAMRKLYEELQKRELFEENKRYFYVEFLNTMAWELQNGRTEQEVRVVYDHIHKTGAAEIGIHLLGEEVFENPFYERELKKFITHEYESLWFLHQVLLYARMEKRKEIFLEIYDNYVRDGVKVTVWGVGPGGRAAYNFFQGHDRKIHYLVDNSKSKQGLLVDGIRVCSYDEVKGDAQLILVPNENYYQAICKQVEPETDRIIAIDIMSYLK